ncbi:hypothetical protein SNEBB_007227 [Seison nebaliae]|nr:hypothetical protein SNEBB_007227 [Seison nebaliae]
MRKAYDNTNQNSRTDEEEENLLGLNKSNSMEKITDAKKKFSTEILLKNFVDLFSTNKRQITLKFDGDDQRDVECHKEYLNNVNGNVPKGSRSPPPTNSSIDQIFFSRLMEKCETAQNRRDKSKDKEHLYQQKIYDRLQHIHTQDNPIENMELARKLIRRKIDKISKRAKRLLFTNREIKSLQELRKRLFDDRGRESNDKNSLLSHGDVMFLLSVALKLAKLKKEDELTSTNESNSSTNVNQNHNVNCSTAENYDELTVVEIANNELKKHYNSKRNNPKQLLYRKTKDLGKMKISLNPQKPLWTCDKASDNWTSQTYSSLNDSTNSCSLGTLTNIPSLAEMVDDKNS